MSDKCPQCGGELVWLAGTPAHETNRYCENEQECGWQAWDRKTWAIKHAQQKPLSSDGGESTAQSVACPTDKEK